MNTTNNGKNGGILSGETHKNGGIKAVVTDTGQPVELETKEVIIKADSVENPEKFNFEGNEMTSKQILSFINQRKGGVPIMEKGGEVGRAKFCPCMQFAEGGNIPDVDYSTKGQESYNVFGHQFDITKAYEMINSKQVDYDIAETKVFSPKNHLITVEPERLKHFDNYDYSKPIGILVYSEKYDTYILIDGNHRMEKAFEKGLKNVPVYLIKDQEGIKKFYDSPFRGSLQMYEDGCQLTELQKHKISQIEKDYELRIRAKELALKGAIAQKNKKSAEILSRCGLFGDTQADPKQVSLFEDLLVCNDQTYNASIKPFVLKIEQIKDDIIKLQSDLNREIEAMSKQAELVFKKGGEITNMPDDTTLVKTKEDTIDFYFDWQYNLDNLKRFFEDNVWVLGTKDKKVFRVDYMGISTSDYKTLREIEKDGKTYFHATSEEDKELNKPNLKEIKKSDVIFFIWYNPESTEYWYKDEKGKTLLNDYTHWFNVQEFENGGKVAPECPCNQKPEILFKQGGNIPDAELEKGIEVEKEHEDLFNELSNRLKKQGVEMPIGKREFFSYIAKTHIKEFDDYYKGLAKMEKALETKKKYADKLKQNKN